MRRSQQRPRGFRRGGTGGQHVVHKQDAFSADGGVGAHAVGQIAATAFGAELHLCRVFIFAGQRGKDGHAPDFAEMLSQQPGLIETPLLKTAAGGRHGNERVAFAQRKGGHGLCQGERRRANAFKFQHQNQFTRLVGIGKSGKGRMDAGGRRSGLKNAAESGERLCAAGAQGRPARRRPGRNRSKDR